MENNNEAKEVTNGGFNSDNTSWASQQDSTSDLNDYFEGSSKNSLHKCRPTVALEARTSPSSEGGNCEVCQLQNADTCVVHFDNSHMSFCMDCAKECYSRGQFCPLCSKRIVYFYKYDNV
ncbi:E3 ubiquitin-protein ligase Mdm2-like [Macrosteles quadrilineatus]|uniref:E3 ubiquitin-protein ligase Mdm2-like n=1 Tax=Macrosteles quadrilineatus TaxID=74068 RepID=UPI0023E30FB7|nr:E3 ubiquitin-protein ligase Mdm2-like [Macrosteles quadrilineatus]XP_054263217.1 E3 ubiquitin-protein ligase Mdm2-like [Macrosteles quadrilineatus]XP_054263218.1 E3 ubiquitin-protein ligase Mdm2-like [Macrosteles quadrilineatus]